MVKTLFYPTYLLLVFGLSLIFIPKKDYKEYFIYGLLVGALADVLLVGFMQNLFHIIWFKNTGIFNVQGQHLLSVPSWLFTVMIYLRFLPQQRPFLYLYIIAFGFASVGYGYLVHNVGLFDFRPWVYPVFGFVVHSVWWGFAAWVFLKTSHLTGTKQIL